MTALAADSATLLTKAPMMNGLFIAVKFDRVNPSGPTNEPATTMVVGSRRKRPTYTKKGRAPSQSSDRRRPPLRGRRAISTSGFAATVNR